MKRLKTTHNIAGIKHELYLWGTRYPRLVKDKKDEQGNVHNIHNDQDYESIAKTKAKESWTSWTSTKCENIEIGREPNEKHLVKALVNPTLLRNRGNSSSNSCSRGREVSMTTDPCVSIPHRERKVLTLWKRVCSGCMVGLVGFWACWDCIDPSIAMLITTTW